MILKLTIFKNINQRFSTLILNVAEKNDSAKMISKLLSNNRVSTSESSYKFNKLYKFKYELNGSINDMIMTSVNGHLMNFAFPQNYRKWETVDPYILFDSPMTKICLNDLIKISLEKIASDSSMLIIWTDCDREGENIGMEIVDTCLAINSKIVVKRARFSEITTRSVTHAINNLVNMDIKVSKAVDIRQELDLKIGAAFSRLQTLCLKDKVPEIYKNQIISYGSCQFPTLGFVVEQYKKVTDFISEPFWKIILTHDINDSIFEYNWCADKSTDENLISKSLEKITENGSLACVIDVKNQKSFKTRPIALDTILLEKLASSKLRMNSKLTMQIAEKLYNNGFISYPRTETNVFSEEIDLRQSVAAQTSDSRWGDFAKKILLDGIKPNCGTKNDNAHPPIIPLKLGVGLNIDETKIFELITRHFLACLSKDALTYVTEVLIECVSKNYGRDIWKHENGIIIASGLGEQFRLSGLSVQERNYLDVYLFDNLLNKSIPAYKIGDIFEPGSVVIKKGKTYPPSLLSEANLISLMDKFGIGTDATHSGHIDKIKTREYVYHNRSNFMVPTKLGIGLVDAYDSVGINLAQPKLRSNFEADLKEICNGKKNANEVLRQYLDEYKSIFSDAIKNINKLEYVILKYLNFGNPSNAQMPTTFSHTENASKIIHELLFENIDLDKNVRNCFCGEPANKNTLKDGQSLYKCKNDRCEYFKLIDRETLKISESKDIIKCNCGKPAKLFISNQNNRNQGRKYYKCNQLLKCKFFYWDSQ